MYKRTVLTPPAFLFSASVHRHVPGNADPPLWSVTPPCAPTGSFTGRTPVRTSSFSVLRPLFPATGRDNGKPVGLVYSPPLPSPMHPVFRTVRGLHAWLHQATTFNEYGPHPRSTIAAAAPWLVCFFGSWHPLLSRRSLRVVPPWQGTRETYRATCAHYLGCCRILPSRLLAQPRRTYVSGIASLHQSPRN